MPTPLPDPSEPSAAAPEFSAWLERFFAGYYAERPVNATFIGRHEHDHRYPDWSPEGLEDTVAEMQAELLALEALPHEPLDPFQLLDRRLARGFLRIQCEEYGSSHFQRRNPALHTGEAVFGLLSLFLTDFAPLPERIERARARMVALPTFLAGARAAVQDAPAPWVERALRECEGGLAFLADGLARLAAAAGPAGERLLQTADVAVRAFSEHRAYLREARIGADPDVPAWGAERFQLLLEEGHFLGEGADALLDEAQAALARAEQQVEQAADRTGGSVADAVARLATRRSTPDGFAARHAEIWEAMRAHALARGLLTWPDFPLRYTERPAWVRSSAPALYFLFYRSPAAFGRPPVHDYLIQPVGSDVPAAEREAVLASTTDSVIKLNHVIHHGGIGHHVQNWNAFRSPSRVGRIAAVDCASRIAMFCGGTMAEGWACYATDLMRECGALTPDEEVSEALSRVRMCARAIVDVELHHGRMTLGDAQAFYERTAGMSAAAAHGEAVKNSMFPGAALMYLVGTDSVHAVRRAAERREGASFSLGDFHDRFLAFGSVPVRLIGEMLENGIDARPE